MPVSQMAQFSCKIPTPLKQHQRNGTTLKYRLCHYHQLKRVPLRPRNTNSHIINVEIDVPHIGKRRRRRGSTQ